MSSLRRSSASRTPTLVRWFFTPSSTSRLSGGTSLEMPSSVVCAILATPSMYSLAASHTSGPVILLFSALASSLKTAVKGEPRTGPATPL